MSANFSFWNMACQQLDMVAKRMNLDPNIHAKMRHCQRSLTVSVPIRMDDGRVTVFEGYREHTDVIQQAMDAVQHHRETVQPIREKTGGSTFKNPPGTSAWKEIDAAGCRGLMIGGAQMSPMHCNFMINTGQATGYELEYLGEIVRSRVLEHSGILLQWEIKRLGKFMPGYEVKEFLGRATA